MTDEKPAGDYEGAALRAAMPVTARWAYFDHAAVAPLPAPTQQTIVDWARDAAENGDVYWSDWAKKNDATRKLAARFLGAGEDEVALVRNTTEGITLVAEGFPWQAGDNVVTLANEFPSNQYPWMNLARRGVETRRVPVDDGRVDVRRLLDACNARTRIVAVSWVGFGSGYRLDLDEVAAAVHQRGALVLLDAIQGLGVFQLDVGRTPIDFLAADGHKWMLGPEGAGLFFCRREHLDRLAPLGVGWHSVVQGGNYSRIELKLKPAAARYEGGSPNMAGFLGFGRSLELLADIGQPTAERRLRAVSDLLCARLTEAGAKIHSARDAAHWSGIVSFTFGADDPTAQRRRCLEQHVVINCREGRLRASPHLYNNEDDIERLVAALRGRG